MFRGRDAGYTVVIFGRLVGGWDEGSLIIRARRYRRVREDPMRRRRETVVRCLPTFTIAVIGREVG